MMMSIKKLNEEIDKVLENYSDIKPNTKQFDIVDKDGYSIDTLYVTPLEDGSFDYWTDTFDSISQATNLKDVIDNVKEQHNTGVGAETVEIIGLNEELDNEIEPTKQLEWKIEFITSFPEDKDVEDVSYEIEQLLENNGYKIGVGKFGRTVDAIRYNREDEE